jgi:hypothetical protein
MSSEKLIENIEDEFKRPISITIVSWFLILQGIIGIAGILLSKKDQITIDSIENTQIQFQTVYILIGMLTSILCGIFVLRRKNWARWLYTLWSGVGIFISPTKIGFSLMILPGFFKYLIIVFFLFSHKSNKWFSSELKGPA